MHAVGHRRHKEDMHLQRMRRLYEESSKASTVSRAVRFAIVAIDQVDDRPQWYQSNDSDFSGINQCHSSLQILGDEVTLVIITEIAIIRFSKLLNDSLLKIIFRTNDCIKSSLRRLSLPHPCQL